MSAKFLGERKGFVRERKVSWGSKGVVRERKVSWGTQMFCEGVQSFLGNAKVL